MGLVGADGDQVRAGDAERRVDRLDGVVEDPVGRGDRAEAALVKRAAAQQCLASQDHDESTRIGCSIGLWQAGSIRRFRKPAQYSSGCGHAAPRWYIV